MSKEKKSERLKIDLRKMQFEGYGSSARNTLNLVIILVFYLLLAVIAACVMFFAFKYGYVVHTVVAGVGAPIIRKVVKMING